MKTQGDTLQSAGTAATVLKALGRLAAPSPLLRVAQESGLPPAKAHRYLQALIGAGLAEQHSETGHYGPGPELIAIGLAALGRIDIMAPAAAVMVDLRDRLGQTCILSVWGNAGPTVVRVDEARGAITTVTRLGSVLPMRSATGIVFAALLDPQRVRDALIDSDAAHNSLIGLEAMRDAVAERGVSTIDGLLLPGIAAIAAPVMDGFGACAGVLCCLGPSGALDAAHDGPSAREIRDAAAIISYRLGHFTEPARG